MDQESSSSSSARKRSRSEEEYEDDNGVNIDLSLSLSIGYSSTTGTFTSNITNLPSSPSPRLVTNPLPLLLPLPLPLPLPFPLPSQQQHSEQFLHSPPISSLQQREEAYQVPPLSDTLILTQQQQQQHGEQQGAIVDPSFLDTVRRQQRQQHEAVEIPPFLNTTAVRSQRSQEEAVEIPQILNVGRRQQQREAIVVPAGLNAVGHAPQRISGRTRRNQSSSNARAEITPPPFPWATNRHAGVYSLEYLISNNLTRIDGEVQCKNCNTQFTYEFDLEKKFREVSKYIYNNKDDLLHRAPNCWRNPELPACNKCEEPNCLKPVMPDKGEKVNWLFLLLGQLLGLCTLGQLKYFCKHTKNHRTGAKDRLLFLTYLGLCKQLDPMGPYDLF